MKIGDPKDSYKALLWDYDWLTTLSDDECSFCLSEREVQLLLSIVEYVGWKTRYIRTLEQPEQNIISKWSGELARKLMSGCCDEQVTNQRYTADGILEQSFDGGETWERDNSDPRFNSPIFPPMSGADGSDKRCLAAASVAAVIKNDIIQKMSETDTAADILAIIAAVVALLITGGLAVPLVIALVSQVIAFGVDATKAAFTTEVWEAFECILFCNMQDDGSFTEAQWQTIKSEIFDQLGSSIAGTFLRDTVNAFGVAGLTNAARSGAASDADCSDCGCIDECAAEGQESYFTVGEVISVTGNVVRVRSVLYTDTPSPFQLVAWGEYGVVGSKCCYIVAVDVVTGSWGGAGERTTCEGIVINQDPATRSNTHFALYPTVETVFDITFPSAP